MNESADPIKLERGILLVAPPVMNDPNFRRSVVLVCEHSDTGTCGLILNQHLTVEMIDVLSDPTEYKDAIHVGGPVQMDTLHFLHRFGDAVSGSVEICRDVFWGGEFDELQETIRGRSVAKSDLRFYLGYAGWSEGQLEAEIESGGWILTRADRNLVFDVDPEELWRSAMIQIGGAHALLANFPDEPRLN